MKPGTPTTTPSTPYRVLIADDEETLRFVLRELLSREGCQVDEAEDGEQAVELARHNGYDLYLLDMKMPRRDGLEALRAIRGLYPDALAVMITAFSSQQLAIEALKAGAYDYFTKPFNIEELRIILLRALDKQTLLRKLRALEQQFAGQARPDGMIGQSAAMRQIFDMLGRVAEHDITVLLTGESGTGKELIAQAIHERSGRKDGPFIKVNCAAIPEPLLESELFGHERGAFTGAVAAKPGKFEAAHGGTILLDEIGEMPLSLQAKLLRVLQERVIERVGSNMPRPVDIRIIAATNRDLQAMVGEKSFREDLFYRLNVVPVHLPPLRERGGDLPALIQHFITTFNTRFGKRIQGLTPEAMARLEAHRWPGNIRELENTIQRMMVMAIGTIIGLEALPPNIMEMPVECAHTTAMDAIGRLLPKSGDDRDRDRDRDSENGNGNGNCEEDFSVPLAQRIERIIEDEERRHIIGALARMNGRRQETADLLGISRKSLHNKMAKYGLFEGEERE